MQPFQQFEQEFGQWAGVVNVVGVASGTAALHVGLESLQLPPGSEVITSDFNMIAVPRACSLAGLTPVFVDCRDDLLMDPALVEQAITERTRAILAVHVYGRLVDLEPICRLANRHGLYVVEDCAESHGARHSWVTAAQCWSMFRNKIICAADAEGGAVAFLHSEHADRARQLRNMGFTSAHDYWHVPRGMNHRLSNVHAALIQDSLRAYPANLAERRRIESWYDDACPDAWRMPPRAAPWCYDVRLPGLTSERQGVLVRRLNEVGIAARHAFKPCHVQPEYAGCRVVGGRVAEQASIEGIYLPLTPGTVTLEQAQQAFHLLSQP
jgi:perosamine synthetase